MFYINVSISSENDWPFLFLLQVIFTHICLILVFITTVVNKSWEKITKTKTNI